jgi:hypothetical protein
MSVDGSGGPRRDKGGIRRELISSGIKDIW